MTPYIQQQLKKLCDNPNWYDDMLISWDKNPTNKIRYIISQLIILTLYTSSLILVSYTYRIILRYIQ